LPLALVRSFGFIGQVYLLARHKSRKIAWAKKYLASGEKLRLEWPFLREKSQTLYCCRIGSRLGESPAVGLSLPLGRAMV